MLTGKLEQRILCKIDTLRTIRYGGHQFGVWAGQLGDGRALSWGKVNVKEGTKLFDYTLSKSWDWQVKGSGKTPYSRDGDGRAV